VIDATFEGSNGRKSTAVKGSRQYLLVLLVEGREAHVFFTKIGILMLWKEIISVYSEKLLKSIQTRCG
jgi:hypothetical protein